MISVALIRNQCFEVFVAGETETRHEVTLTNDYYLKLTQRKITQEWLVAQSFVFLLEREANTSIHSQFDLSEIRNYFPEFEVDIRHRLHLE